MSVIDLVYDARPRDLGGVGVRRALPSAKCHSVGPFVFLDHIGPVELPVGRGIDVRPHPHIALATLTYLFAGDLVHRDSLGSVQTIVPGDVNWMSAGRGIVHSERTSPDSRATGSKLHGLQSWVALPKEAEESAPTFRHYPRATIPTVRHRDCELTVIAGHLFDQRSPVEVLTDTVYALVRLPSQGVFGPPRDVPERAIYVVEGTIETNGNDYAPGSLVVFHRDHEVALRAETDAQFIFLGGAPLDGPRHIWWNFVSSDPARIEQAKIDWKEQRFPKIPGDDRDLMPLPEK
jgi:redox-sensitive bicupin YhaK (pirin superfamily)